MILQPKKLRQTVRDKTDYIIQAVSQALDLLEQFRGADDELSIMEFAKRLKLQKNNVIRLLATLEGRGYIEQNRMTGNYRLGFKALQLGQATIRQMGLLRHAGAALEQVVKECNETAYLAVFREGAVVYLHAVETDQPVRVVSRIGARLPLYCTASGKVYLAFLPESDREAHLPKGDFPRFTPRTFVEPEALSRELEKIARSGYAIDHEECEPGVCCVAAPVRDYSQQVIGTLVISGPYPRLSPARVEDELAPLILRAAGELSKRLGYDPTPHEGEKRRA